MNKSIKNKFLAVDFPERMVQQYLFKGYDLKDESIFNNLKICYEALNAFAKDIYWEQDKLKPELTPNQLIEYKKRLKQLENLQKELIPFLKTSMDLKKEFSVLNSKDEEIIIKTCESWDYLCLGATMNDKFSIFLVKRSVKALDLYIEFKAKRYLKNFAKNKRYVEYLKTQNIIDKKLIAHELLGLIQKVWAAQETVIPLAYHLGIEIVTTSHLEMFSLKNKVNG